MPWVKRKLALTDDQRKRGVVFSSALLVSEIPERRSENEKTVHEVFAEDQDREATIDRLKDVSFFKTMARKEHWHVVEIQRS